MGMGAWRRVIGTVGWTKPSSKSWVVTSPPLMGTGTLMGSGVDWDMGHWTLVLLGALIGYRCSLGRCRDLVLVGPLEVLVLTGHGCRDSTGASARSRMQRSHAAPGFPCQ